MVAITSFLATAVTAVGIIGGVDAQFNVKGAGGGVHVRYEMEDMRKHHKTMWNLFLLSMAAFQKENQNDQLSYYGIAGIHGAPYTSWQGVQQTGNGGGYCTHSSNLFCPWHRPYLAAFEQRLQDHAQRIAKGWQGGDRGAVQQAANEMRVPYWDWAKSGKRVMPKSMVTKGIKVKKPNGQHQSIHNPLYSYRFHPLNSGALIFSPTNQWKETKRQPGGGAQPQSNNGAVENTFESQRPGNRQSIYSLFAQGGQYNQISNWGIGSQGNNFEAVHNNIHAGFGGNSHMSLPVLAAFDPAFWLHHANVDRLIAIWQGLHPQTYVRPTQQSGGTWTIQQGSTQGPKSPLKPFHRGRKFWTSASARGTKIFGYTYPELRDNPSQATLRSRVNRLYGGAVGVSKAAATKMKRDVSTTYNTVPNVDITLNVTAGDTLYQYTAEIIMPVSHNDSPYNLFVFLGEPTSEPADYLTDANLVGLQASLGTTTDNLISGDPGRTLPATVFLTDRIVADYAAGKLDHLDQDTVESYLNDNLHWRAAQNGAPITEDDAPAIEVHIIAQEVEAVEGEDTFPNFHGKHHVGKVNGTRPGRPGGY